MFESLSNRLKDKVSLAIYKVVLFFIEHVLLFSRFLNHLDRIEQDLKIARERDRLVLLAAILDLFSQLTPVGPDVKWRNHLLFFILGLKEVITMVLWFVIWK